MVYRFKGRKYSQYSMGSKAYQPFKYIQKGSTTHKTLALVGKYSYSHSGVAYNKIKNSILRGPSRLGYHTTTQGLDRTLRRLERTGLTTRPKTGFYLITGKGKKATAKESTTTGSATGRGKKATAKESTRTGSTTGKRTRKSPKGTG